jgi:hypothetical protein
MLSQGSLKKKASRQEERMKGRQEGGELPKWAWDCPPGQLRLKTSFT